MYKITHDISKRIVYVKLSGFIQLPEMIEYGTELTSTLDKIPYKVFLLVDALENKVMPQDSIEELNKIRERNKTNLLKSAVVLNNPLLEKQTERTYKKVNVEWEEQYFNTIMDAESWLFSFKNLKWMKNA